MCMLTSTIIGAACATSQGPPSSKTTNNTTDANCAAPALFLSWFDIRHEAARTCASSKTKTPRVPGTAYLSTSTIIGAARTSSQGPPSSKTTSNTALSTKETNQRTTKTIFSSTSRIKGGACAPIRVPLSMSKTTTTTKAIVRSTSKFTPVSQTSYIATYASNAKTTNADCAEPFLSLSLFDVWRAKVRALDWSANHDPEKPNTISTAEVRVLAATAWAWLNGSFKMSIGTSVDRERVSKTGTTTSHSDKNLIQERVSSRCSFLSLEWTSNRRWQGSMCIRCYLWVLRHESLSIHLISRNTILWNITNS